VPPGTNVVLVHECRRIESLPAGAREGLFDAVLPRPPRVDQASVKVEENSFGVRLEPACQWHR